MSACTGVVDFKKTTGEMKEAMVSISSILNKHGIGTLYFGVKPSGDVIGQDVSESSLRDVSRAVYENIRPQIYPVVEEVVLDHKHLIKVEFSGENAPYSAAGRYYLRTADEDREVTPDELKAFFVANKYRELWEKGKSNAAAKQIDKLAIKSFWQKAVSAGRLPDGRYTCPIILKNIRWRSEITGMEREEIPEIPVAVIREVLANSFAHAIYNGRTTHEICIHPGMITVYSPGEYASKHKPEEYIKDNIESEIRNATIAKILYLSKSIEQFGSGFKRINSLCNDAGIKYSYENRENGFKFVIYRPELQNDIPSVTLDVTLNGMEMAVLAILKQKPDSSRDEMADKISKTVRTVQRALDSLRDKGYIRRVGSKQNPVWEILK